MIAKIIKSSMNNLFLVISAVLLLIAASIWAIRDIPLDAIPDLTPPQIIVNVKWEGQSPQIIEDQIIYPLTKSLMSIAGAKTVRAFSSFENAMVYIIFDEKIDIYWARDRVSETMSELGNSLPKNAELKLGPDATGIGWVYEYALKSKTKSLDELRIFQDYFYKYALLGVDGVSEVATVGGFEKNYQVTINQDRLVNYSLSLEDVIKAIKENNNDAGGRILIENGFEYIIQAKGYAKNIQEIESIVLYTKNKIPLKISDIAKVEIVPSYRRGVAELNGEGEVVGGIVVARYGENAYKVIEEVKKKLESIKIEEIEVVGVYDRSELIDKAIGTLKTTLIEESILILIIVSIFLLHFRSSVIIIISLPIIVLITFLLMKLFNIESNIMSLGGIAIAIGAMVDACIVMVENAHKKLQNRENLTFNDRFLIIYESSTQVGRPIFFALMLIIVSFLPIFALSGQEGALFRSLAFTKTFAMLIGAILSITLIPLLLLYFLKGGVKDELKNPLNRFFIYLYSPVIRISLKIRYLLIFFAITSVVYGIWLYQKQKWEFMPALNEETFMYMPVTPNGISIDLAKELSQKTNILLKEFQEVDTVFAKAGRADTATDPAPLSMIETIVTFKPKSEWREGVTYKTLLNEMEEKLQIQGLVNSWTYPIRGRIDMLLTGIRTPLGIKLYGDDNEKLEHISKKIEKSLSQFEGTRSVFADKTNTGYFLNIDIDTEKITQYEISKELIFSYINSAIGGAKISTFYDGIKRHPISLRLDEKYRGDINSINEILVKTKYGFLPLKNFAKIYYSAEPSMLKSEKGKKVAFIYITPSENITSKSYKKEANELLKKIELPDGYFMEWSGESEYLESAMKRLEFIIPFTLLITFILIYLGLNSFTNSLIVFLSLPIAAVGGIIYVDYLDFNFSIAVVVGFLALIGVAAETAIVMIIYLEEAVKKLKTITQDSLKEAIFEGAALRVRPKLMTVFATLGGLLPIMFIEGVGSEVMQRIAAPMIGGIISSSILTLLVVPAVYYMIQNRKCIKNETNQR